MLARPLPLCAGEFHCHLSHDNVTAAPFRPIATRRGVAFVAFALFLASALSACKGDAANTVPRKTGAAATPGVTNANAAGDVVIAPPTAAYTVATVNAPGTISGTVTLKSALEPVPPTPTGGAGVLCGATIADESVRAQGGGLAGAVVWLDGVRRGKALGLERRLELESDHCKLVPRVQAAAVGSAVNIIGHDNLRQHLLFATAGETAPRATILLGGGEQVIPTELPFKAPGMVAVRDAEHAWTHAYLAVFDHPYFAVTGAGGSFTIDGVPAGKYTLRVWHERTGATAQPVEVAASGSVKVAVALEGK